MKKYFKLNMPRSTVTVTNSGTTTVGTANKLTDTNGTPNFDSTVSVGDIVVANNIAYVVTAVDSSSVLSVSGGGVPTTTAYVIYSGASATEELIPVSDVLTVVATSSSVLVLTYSSPVSGYDTLTITTTAAASAFATQTEFQNQMISLLQKKWHEVSSTPSLSVTVGKIAYS